MSQYFSKFPKFIYNKNITINILTRIKLLNGNDSLFNDYYVKDDETPELLSNKFYNDPEKHWIILNTNNIINPIEQWPLSQAQFLKYLDVKYSSEGSMINRTGSEYALITLNNEPFSYRKIIKIFNINEQIETIEKVWIDELTFQSFVPTQSNISVGSQSYIYSESVERVYIYTYEDEINENKKIIKILKQNYVFEFQNQFEILLAK